MKRITAAFMALILIFLVSGCVKKADTYLFTNKDKSWSIRMPNEFIKDKEESDEQQKSETTHFKTEKETSLVINEITDEKLVINEDILKAEFEEDHYLKAERFNTVEIKDVGTVYGAVVTDEVTGMSMLYYRMKYKDEAISFILYRKGAFTLDQEAKAIAMIGTFKGLK
jgi:hypothetical protein